MARVRCGLQRENGHDGQERLDRDGCVPLPRAVYFPSITSGDPRGCEARSEEESSSSGGSESVLALQ